MSNKRKRSAVVVLSILAGASGGITFFLALLPDQNAALIAIGFGFSIHVSLLTIAAAIDTVLD